MKVVPRTMAARAALDKARQQHILAAQAALDAGVSAEELEQDCAAFDRGVRQSVALRAAMQNTAPMVLAVAE